MWTARTMYGKIKIYRIHYLLPMICRIPADAEIGAALIAAESADDKASCSLWLSFCSPAESNIQFKLIATRKCCCGYAFSSVSVYVSVSPVGALTLDSFDTETSFLACSYIFEIVHQGWICKGVAGIAVQGRMAHPTRSYKNRLGDCK